MDDVNLHDQIERYINNQLMPDELLAFEERLTKEKDLAESIALHKDVMMSIRHYNEEEIRQNIKAVHLKKKKVGFFSNNETNKDPKSGKVVFFSKKLLFSIAATLLVIIIAGWWFFSNESSTKGEQLFALHYNPYPDKISEELSVIISGEGFASVKKEDIEIFLQSMQKYSQGDYLSACQGFDEFLKTESDQELKNQALFYQAISYLGNNQAKKAIPILETLAKEKDFEKNADLWYLALAYLSIENGPKAKVILDTLVGDDDFKSSATEMIQQLQ